MCNADVVFIFYLSVLIIQKLYYYSLKAQKDPTVLQCLRHVRSDNISEDKKGHCKCCIMLTLHIIPQQF